MGQTKTLKRPIVMYNVTEECQLRCRHCYNESGKAKKTVSPEILEADVRKLCLMSGAINFTGGEPFLVGEMPRLLKIASGQGIDTIITTNGLRFQEPDGEALLEEIQDHVYMVKIGMMGSTPETNDVVRGRGNFEVCIKSLDLLAQFDLVSCMKISLDRHNVHEIEDMVRLAVEHQVDQIVFGQLVSSGRAATHLKGWAFSQEELRKANQEIYRVRHRYPVKISRHCTISGLCSEPGLFYTVNARGGVSPCLMREDLAIGNIRTQNPVKIFQEVDRRRSCTHTHSSVRVTRNPNHAFSGVE